MATLRATFEGEHASSAGSTRRARSLTFILGAYAVGNLTAYVRDATIAGVYGAGASTDAYFVSAFLPTLLATLLVYESLVPVVLPAFARLRFSPLQERDLARRLALLVGPVLIGISVALMLAAPIAIHLLASGWSARETETGTQLLRVTGGSLTFLGLGALVASIANARHRFLAPPIGLGVSNVVVMATTLAFSHRLGIFAPAWGVLLGSAAYLVIQIVALRDVWGLRSPMGAGFAAHVARSLDTSSGVGSSETLTTLLPALVPMLLFAALAQSVPVVERWLSSGLPAGQLSYLTYAGKLMMSPILVITAATNLLSFVGLSHDDNGDGESFRQELGRGARVTGGLLLLATLTLILFRGDLVALTLEHGHFSAHDAAMTSTLLAIYALGLIPNGLSWLLYRSCQARGEYGAGLAVMAIQTLVYVVISLALFARWKLTALPAAFAIGQTFQLLLLAGVQFKLLRPAFRAIRRYVAALAAMALLGVAVEWLIQPSLSALARHGDAGLLAALSAGIGVLLVSCASCAVLFGVVDTSARFMLLRAGRWRKFTGGNSSAQDRSGWPGSQGREGG